MQSKGIEMARALVQPVPSVQASRRMFSLDAPLLFGPPASSFSTLESCAGLPDWTAAARHPPCVPRPAHYGSARGGGAGRLADNLAASPPDVRRTPPGAVAVVGLLLWSLVLVTLTYASARWLSCAPRRLSNRLVGCVWGAGVQMRKRAVTRS